VLDLRFSRIQFTPDLMPGDITGTMVMETSEVGHKGLRFEPGPIFANLVLADEINRATPKTQSALLEAMQEGTVTAGAHTYTLEQPFMVMATQNPIEMEGTYPLPEAQLDRFLMKIVVVYPSHEELARIVELTTEGKDPDVAAVLDREQIAELRATCRTVLVAPHVRDFAVRLVMATQPNTSFAPAITSQYVRYGSSPRGAQALIECGRVQALLSGRMHLSVDDIKAVAPSVLRHRLILNYDGHADGYTNDSLLAAILER
jgi:MoxR-like ATPase